MCNWNQPWILNSVLNTIATPTYGCRLPRFDRCIGVFGNAEIFFVLNDVKHVQWVPRNRYIALYWQPDDNRTVSANWHLALTDFLLNILIMQSEKWAMNNCIYYFYHNKAINRRHVSLPRSQLFICLDNFEKKIQKKLIIVNIKVSSFSWETSNNETLLKKFKATTDDN